LIKIIILEENFKWHLEAFASELFIYIFASYVVRKWPVWRQEDPTRDGLVRQE